MFYSVYVQVKFVQFVGAHQGEYGHLWTYARDSICKTVRWKSIKKNVKKQHLERNNPWIKIDKL